MRLLIPLLLLACGTTVVQAGFFVTDIYNNIVNSVASWWARNAEEECPGLKKLVRESGVFDENALGVSAFYFTYYACEERAESNEWVYDKFFGRLGYFVRALASLPLALVGPD